MRAISILRLRLRSLAAHARVEEELDEELRYHLERETEAGMAAGLPPDEARYAALRSLGALEANKEECRDRRGIRWLEDLAGDLRYASRQFRKQPAFFAVAAVTLALGIGANSAIFSAVNAVLFRPLPYREPAQLSSIWCTLQSKGIPRMGCALPDLREMAAGTRSFAEFANYFYADINITDGTPERVVGVLASASLFPLLGVRPVLGRTFSPAEETFGSHRVVVLGHSIWMERFGGAANVLGSAVHLNGEPFTVVGVMPAGFAFPIQEAKLWLPMSFAPQDGMATRDNHFIDAIARRRAGVTVGQSRADLQAVARRLELQFPENTGGGADTSEYLASLTGDVRPVLLILLGAVGVVLLIACVNVANLLLSRASGRQRELSLRAALGASRGRVIRQLLTEGLLLGAAGAGLGLALAFWLVRLIRTYGPADVPRLQSIEIDASVLAFTAAVTLLSVLLFAVAPALSLSRRQLVDFLKDGGRSLTTGLRTNRSRDVLAVAEIALSMLLVVGAGLLFRTLIHLRDVDPGFRPENVLTFSVTLPPAKYPDSDPSKRPHFFDELIQRLEKLPGARAAGASTALPVRGWGGWGKYITLDRSPAARLSDVPLIQYRQVTPGFAKALGVRMLQGRFFTNGDTGDRPLVAVINQTAARRFFPGRSPIGERVYANPPESLIRDQLPSPGYRFPRLTIVGVIDDVRHAGLAEPPVPELLVPHLQGTAKDNQTSLNRLFLFLKTDGDPLKLANGARAVVRSLDVEQPVADVADMEGLLRESLSLQRFELNLFGAFALIALTLAVVGIYGVLACGVRLRTQEIGVRLALGATRGDVLRLVARHGFLLGITGILAGAGLGLGAARWMSSLLFGVRPNDPATFVLASLVLLAAVALATLLPSARAGRTDALTVLRSE